MLAKIVFYLKSVFTPKEKERNEDAKGFLPENIKYQDELLKNKNKIVELKEEYRDIFVINLMDEEFVFRPLSKYEYFEYIINNSGVNKTILSEFICSLCVVYPESYDFKNPKYAGIPDVLFEEIKEKSGFTNDEMIKAQAANYRALNINDFDHQMENMIMTAFPSIKLDEMKKWSIYKLLDYFARAEWVVDNMMPLHKLPNKEDEGQEQRGSAFLQNRRR